MNIFVTLTVRNQRHGLTAIFRMVLSIVKNKTVKGLNNKNIILNSRNLNGLI